MATRSAEDLAKEVEQLRKNNFELGQVLRNVQSAAQEMARLSPTMYHPSFVKSAEHAANHIEEVLRRTIN